MYENEEPSRTVEALQSWEALSNLCNSYSSGDVNGDLDAFGSHIQKAIQLWSRLQAAGFAQEVEPNIERLEAIRDAIGIFKKWAELD